MTENNNLNRPVELRVTVMHEDPSADQGYSFNLPIDMINDLVLGPRPVTDMTEVAFYLRRAENRDKVIDSIAKQIAWAFAAQLDRGDVKWQGAAR